MAALLPLQCRISAFRSSSTSFTRLSRQLQAQRSWSNGLAGGPISQSAPVLLQRRVKDRNWRTPASRLHTKKDRLEILEIRGASTVNHAQKDTQEDTKLPAPYAAPTTGLLSILPQSWVPYAELIRLDKPTGTYYLFFPCLFSTLLAAPLTDPITPPLTILTTSTLFFLGALIMRGAGCTINDIWDRNFDPKVARTRNRPIARGAISVNRAIPFLGVQLFAGLAVLLQFPLSCFFYATPSLLFVATYPLAKRVTNYPQFVLGLTFSWGAMMGFPALGVDLLSNTPALVSAGCLYASCVAWTLVYDMIYAYQDLRDDAKAGIKSIARAQEANGKVFLSAVSAVQGALLAGAGYAIAAGPVFYVGVCGGAAGSLGYMIQKVNLKSVSDCWAWFKNGAWITGGVVSAGLGAEYLAKKWDMYGEAKGKLSVPSDEVE